MLEARAYLRDVHHNPGHFANFVHYVAQASAHGRAKHAALPVRAHELRILASLLAAKAVQLFI